MLMLFLRRDNESKKKKRRKNQSKHPSDVLCCCTARLCDRSCPWCWTWPFVLTLADRSVMEETATNIRTSCDCQSGPWADTLVYTAYMCMYVHVYVCGGASFRSFFFFFNFMCEAASMCVSVPRPAIAHHPALHLSSETPRRESPSRAIIPHAWPFLNNFINIPWTGLNRRVGKVMAWCLTDADSIKPASQQKHGGTINLLGIWSRAATNARVGEKNREVMN